QLAAARGCAWRDRVEQPGSGDTFELVLAACLELKARSRGAANHCGGDESLTCFREPEDSSSDHYGDAGDVVAASVDVTDMDPDTNFEFFFTERGVQLPRCAERVSHRRDDREDAGAWGLDDGAAAATDTGTRHCVVPVEQAFPVGVAHRGGACGGGDQVGVQHRGQRTLRFGYAIVAG